jgi:hypothetical protein
MQSAIIELQNISKLVIAARKIIIPKSDFDIKIKEILLPNRC